MTNVTSIRPGLSPDGFRQPLLQQATELLAEMFADAEASGVEIEHVTFALMGATGPDLEVVAEHPDNTLLQDKSRLGYDAGGAVSTSDHIPLQFVHSRASIIHAQEALS